MTFQSTPDGVIVTLRFLYLGTTFDVEVRSHGKAVFIEPA